MSESKWVDLFLWMANEWDVGVFVIKDGVVKHVNPWLCNLVKGSEKELTGREFLEFIHPDDRDKVRDVIKKRLNNASVPIGSCVFRVLAKDGTVVWVETSSAQVEGALVGTVVDITKKVMLEQALNESEEQLRMLVDSVEEYAIFMLEDNGRIVDWNRGAERVYGYSMGEVIGEHLSMFYTEGGLERGVLEKELEEARTKGKYKGEGWRIRKDGSSFLAEITIYRIESSVFRGFSKIARDITKERKKHTFLQLLSRCSRLAVSATDERTFLSEICKAIVEVGGYRLAWVGYLKDKEIVPFVYHGHEDGYLDTLKLSLGDVKRMEGPTGRALRTGRTQIVRDTAADPSFEPWREEALKRGYRSSIAIPLIYRDEVIGILNIYSSDPYAFNQYFLEIGDVVALGLSMLRTINELEDVSVKLLHLERLTTAGTLLGGIMHEIRNPLSVALMNTELLLDESEEMFGKDMKIEEVIKKLPERVEIVEDIQTAVVQIKNIVDGLMDFVRRKEEKESVRVKDSVDTTLTMVAYPLRKSNVFVEKHVEDVRVRANRTQMIQLLTNLLINAIDALNEKYSEPDDNKRIVLRAWKENENAVISVCD